MIDILYYAFIFPLQSVLGFALDSLHSLTNNYGISIIILSLLVNLFLLKLAKIAESKATKINALKSVCDKKIAEFKRVFKGAELQSYIRILYKQKHYHPIFALSALGGLALQVPFFIAVLCLLQEFEGIKGVSFLWISDLSAPDNIFGIHLLPILMTIISLINVWIVAKDKGARIQGVLIALIFLVLLYQMPSALVLYWTTNMGFSLGNSLLGMQFRRFAKSPQGTDAKSAILALIWQKLQKPHRNNFDCLDNNTQNPPSLAEGARGWVKSSKSQIQSNPQLYHQISIYATLCIAFLICVFTPYQLYSTDITQFDSSQTYATLSALFGAFLLISFIMIYALSFVPKRFGNIIAFILSVILFSGIVYSFILVGDYGAMDRFILQKTPFIAFDNLDETIKQGREFVLVVVSGILVIAFALNRLKLPLQIIFATLFIVSVINAIQIINKQTEFISTAIQSDKNKPPFADSPLFSYSKNDKNIVVLVLDAFSGSHTPYILEQFPEFKTKLDGFTLFPNTISSGNSTIQTISSLVAGQYYAGYNVNQRKDNLIDSINEGFMQIGEHFADNGFAVGIYTALTWMGGGYKLFKSHKFFNVDNEELFFGYFILNNKDELRDIDMTTSAHTELPLLLQFGLFRFLPNIFKGRIYNGGDWHFVDKLEANIKAMLRRASTTYAFTHFGNTNSTKPTFKFFHSFITHTPYSIYFKDGKCRYGKQKSAWNDYSHKVNVPKLQEGVLYQHYDAEICAISYLAHYVKWLKNVGIYDNTQIFVVSDHGNGDVINISLPNIENPNPDSLLMFKNFGAKGALRVDNRLMANYDIASIFCANLKGGCPNVPKNILQNYPTNREIIHTIPLYWQLAKHKSNEWLITKAYKVKDNIYESKNWVDISESSDIVNAK